MSKLVHVPVEGAKPLAIQDENATGLYVVKSAQAARLLRNDRLLAFLSVFLAGPSVLSKAALQCQLPISTCSRMATRLLAQGLLVVDSVTQRAGRPITRYRAPGKRIFVPYSFEHDLLPDELMRRITQKRVTEQSRLLIEAGRKTLLRSGHASWGTLIYADRQGGLVMRPDFEPGRTPALLDEGTPSYVNLYASELNLTGDDAKQLQRRLVELFMEYKDKSGTGGFSLSLVLAPKA
ncbi:hypothetical protein [Rhodoferax sp.]|jgi:hypothetical protein|uniref:hypothetical protein n=1 Tax=Rhodoferax sp. TaxID=50421 RepID=UPI00378403E8